MALPLLLAAYLVAAHYSVTASDPYPGLTILTLILLRLMWPSLRRGRPAAWLAVAALAAALALLLSLERGELLLYLPPVAINLLFLIGFLRSLQPGETPLITRIAIAFGEELTPQRQRYTRQVTVAWTLLFAALTAECLLLALLAPPALWSLFTNGINYLLVATLFVGEYLLRRRLFPQPQGFRGFLRELRRIDFRRLMYSQKPSP